eukprot:5658337-Pleurochrysis_carterae.AAC.1
MSALDAVIGICDCKDRRLKRRVRYNCAGAHLGPPRKKNSKFDVRGAVYHHSHRSSSPTAEPAEL